MKKTTASLIAALVVFCLSSAATAQTSQPLHMLTWNVRVGANESAARTQMQFIAALPTLPHVIVLQEASSSLRSVYKSELNLRTGLTWNDAFKGHCISVSGGVCQGDKNEGVVILTSLQMLDSQGRHFLYADEYHAGRGALRAKIAFGGGVIQVYNVHLQPDRPTARQNSVRDLKNWMIEPDVVLSPRFAGGDFNAGPTEAEIANMTTGMAETYQDAWIAGSGNGYTAPNPSLAYRIDYWFSDRNGRAFPSFADTPSTQLSDHLPVFVTYNVQAASTPYSGSAVGLPGIIQAEHYDHAGEGVAYHDDTTANLGGSATFRADQAVDTQVTTDTGSGHNVGWVRAGEWLNYTISVPSTADYAFSARVASLGPGGTFHLEVNGQNVSGPIAVPDTGGWQSWQTVSAAAPVHLTGGTQILRVVADSVGSSGSLGNWNYFQFASGGSPSSSPYSGAPIVVPAIIQAEHFDHGGEGIAYHDASIGNTGGAFRQTDVDVETTADAGGGYAIGWFGAGEWLNYSIDVPANGTYDLFARVAHPGPGGTFHIEVGGVNVSGPIQVPDTGGWASWQTVSRTGITLQEGLHYLRFVADTASASTTALGNLNWIELRAAGETLLFEDAFQSAALDTAKWNRTIISGSQDPAVPVTQSGGQLQVGPLLEQASGLHYNGISSVNRLNLNGAYVSVQRVAHPNTSGATTMSFTLPLDGSNHYRIFLEMNQLHFEKKLGGVKTSIQSPIPFSAASHAFWRIRHGSSDTIVFETAPNNNGAPGSWTPHASVARELDLSLVYVELKAGTFQPVTAPGSAVFDNVRAARQ